MQCAVCGKELTGEQQMFCSTKCANLYNAARRRAGRRLSSSELMRLLSVEELLSLGFDRFCPLCDTVLRPGEEKQCNCPLPPADLRRGQIPGVHYPEVTCSARDQ